MADYLEGLAVERPDIAFRMAWWDSPRAIVVEWTLIGAAVLGGLWPPVLLLLVGAGWGRRKKEEPYDLDRFHHGPDGGGGNRELSDEERRRLEELEAEMMAGLGSGPDAQASSNVEPAPQVRMLAGEEPEAVPAEGAELKDFDGEFYPVEKKVPHGFSLVELLVGMGIIAVLIALLMPTIVTAQRHAQATQCASNLRQIGMALQSYANANQGWLPAWSGWHTWPIGTSDDSTGPAWTIELMPYIGPPDSPVYNCPSFPSRVKCRNYFLAAQWSGKSGKHAMKLTDVTMAGRFVLSGDKTQRGLYPPPFGSSEHLLDDADPDDNGDGMPVLAWPWGSGGFYMHQGGNNVLFDDIHVALFTGFDKFAMTFNPHRMQKWAEVTAD